MGVRQADYNSSRGTELLKLALMEKAANESIPGRVPSGIAENAYFSSMPNTNEQEREASDIEAMDAGATSRYEARQNQNEMFDQGTRAAHYRGFKDQPALEASERQDAFSKLLIPARYKAQAEAEKMDFDASEHALDRRSREGIASRAAAGQMDRTQATQQGIAARQLQVQQNNRNPVRKLYDWVTGAKPPTVPSPVSAAANPGGTVMMQTPAGDIVSVPASDVQDAIANGATPVQ